MWRFYGDNWHVCLHDCVCAEYSVLSVVCCVYCMYMCELGWTLYREQNYWKYGMKLMKLPGNEKSTVSKTILFYHFKLFLQSQNSKKKKKILLAQEIDFKHYFRE